MTIAQLSRDLESRKHAVDLDGAADETERLESEARDTLPIEAAYRSQIERFCGTVKSSKKLDEFKEQASKAGAAIPRAHVISRDSLSFLRQRKSFFSRLPRYMVFSSESSETVYRVDSSGSCRYSADPHYLDDSFKGWGHSIRKHQNHIVWIPALATIPFVFAASLWLLQTNPSSILLIDLGVSVLASIVVCILAVCIIDNSFGSITATYTFPYALDKKARTLLRIKPRDMEVFFICEAPKPDSVERVRNEDPIMIGRWSDGTLAYLYHFDSSPIEMKALEGMETQA